MCCQFNVFLICSFIQLILIIDTCKYATSSLYQIPEKLNPICNILEVANFLNQIKFNILSIFFGTIIIFAIENTTLFRMCNYDIDIHIIKF